MDFVCKTSSVNGAAQWIIDCSAVEYAVCFHLFSHFHIQSARASWKPKLKSQPLHGDLAGGITASILCIIGEPLSVKARLSIHTSGRVSLSLLAATLIRPTFGGGPARRRGDISWHTAAVDRFDSHSALFAYCMLLAYNIWLQAGEEPSNESVPPHMHRMCHRESFVLYTYAYPVCLLLKHLYF